MQQIRVEDLETRYSEASESLSRLLFDVTLSELHREQHLIFTSIFIRILTSTLSSLTSCVVEREIGAVTYVCTIVD